MAEIDMEMWQDFVVEARENLEEFEPNVLLLEQQPDDMALLNDCFRNMHSIKGAANYMGLKAIATLAHRMESLFHAVRSGELTLSQQGFDLLFLCVDRMKTLVRDVEENQQENHDVSDLISSLEELLQAESSNEDGDHAAEQVSASAMERSVDEAETLSPPVVQEIDEDQELLAIFREEMKSLFGQLQTAMDGDDRDLQAALDLLRDMERVTNYVGQQELSRFFAECAERVEQADSASGGENVLQPDKLLTEISERLSAGLEMAFLYDPQQVQEGTALISEEDPELYQIFLDFFSQEGRSLSLIPANPDMNWVKNSREAAERLQVSANYMDYEPVVAILQEWMDLADQCLEQDDVSVDEVERFHQIWNRLVEVLPDLKGLFSETAPGEASDENLAVPDGVMDEGDPISKDPESLGALIEDEIEGLFQDMTPGSAEGLHEKDVEIGETGAGAGENQADEVDTAIEAMFSGVSGDEPLEVDQHVHAQEQEEPALEVQKTAEPASASTLVEKDSAIDMESQVFEAEPSNAAEDFLMRQMDEHLSGGGEAFQEPHSRGGSASKGELIKVDLSKVESLLGDVGELVVLRSSLAQASDELKGIYNRWLEERLLGIGELRPLKEVLLRFSENAAALERVVQQLQDGIMRIRMLPVSTIFNRYPRLVRDLSRKLGKEVELNLYGAETSLDKQVIEQLADPMQHIVRNAVDHGIEDPATRTARGKAATGRLVISSAQEGNSVVITVSDDGKGLDRSAILKKAVEMGLMRHAEAQSLSDSQVWNLIFLPGMTTASTVSDVSGRGVGLDVVKSNIERIGGTISVSSQPGKGTIFVLRIPLTLAIIKGLVVRVGHQAMVIPVASVKETFKLDEKEICEIEGYEIISIRQQTLPLIRLNKVFRGTGASEQGDKLFAVRVSQGSDEVCLGVDELIGQQEVVIKPLSDYLTQQPGFSGATILGDGSIALILDLRAMLEKARKFVQKKQKIMEQEALGLAPGEQITLH